ncbi:hypothetical protein VP01_1658g4 [Puccinia sorghi]|uniref:Uncharacterized protein n=1 Tax=Puccinia sorghi TaxID=27349 RepID=A0A0L6VGF2_9BASI|nr:hypothetical protein VP01_1658g4 [Puccinia sorghi]
MGYKDLSNDCEDTGEWDLGATASEIPSTSPEDALQKARRDRLANKLWRQYLSYTGRRAK